MNQVLNFQILITYLDDWNFIHVGYQPLNLKPTYDPKMRKLKKKTPKTYPTYVM